MCLINPASRPSERRCWACGVVSGIAGAVGEVAEGIPVEVSKVLNLQALSAERRCMSVLNYLT